MTQIELTRWVKPRLKKSRALFRFLADLPEVMAPKGRRVGPFRKGDLVDGSEIPDEVARVLIRRRVVEVFHYDPFECTNAQKRTQKLYKH